MFSLFSTFTVIVWMFGQSGAVNFIPLGPAISLCSCISLFNRRHNLKFITNMSLWHYTFEFLFSLFQEAICNAEEQIRDVDHVETLKKKFDDFHKVSLNSVWNFSYPWSNERFNKFIKVIYYVVPCGVILNCWIKSRFKQRIWDVIYGIAGLFLVKESEEIRLITCSFLQDLIANEIRITEANDTVDKFASEEHPDIDDIRSKCKVHYCLAWKYLHFG